MRSSGWATSCRPGTTATVDFFGERFDINVNELLPRGAMDRIRSERWERDDDSAFRRSFEAVNLGVVRQI